MGSVGARWSVTLALTDGSRLSHRDNRAERPGLQYRGRNGQLCAPAATGYSRARRNLLERVNTVPRLGELLSEHPEDRMPPAAFLRRLTRAMSAEAAPESDQELVRRLLATRDEGAFEAIVRRHGPMVYRVCWRVAGQEQDAEDAFQATFLVLARNLHAVRKHDSLASWLHGTARRLALKAKTRAAARGRHESAVPRTEAVSPEDTTWSEVRAILDEELARLPERWRLPLLLCYLQGRTQDEAAAGLGWAKSTLRRRLTEARDALAARLSRRGVLPAALSAVLVSECVAPALVAPILHSVTLGSAVPERVTALTHEAVAMTLKLKLAAGAVLVIAALGWSAVGWGEPSRAAYPPRPAEKDGKPKADPWVGEFRVYDGHRGEKGEVVAAPSKRHGGKVTITPKGDGYVFEGGGKIDLIKAADRLEPSSDAGFKWIELGEKAADGFHTLQVVGSFNVVHLVRDKPPATWTVLPGEAKPGRGPAPPAAVLSDWRAGAEYRLDGLSHVRVDDHPDLRLSALTLSAWVNTTDVGAMQPVVAKAQAKGNWNSYMLRIQDGGRISLAVENVAGDRSAHWTTKEKLAAKKWHHVAATWACAKGNATDAKIYIDGVEQEVEMNRSVNYGKDFKIGYSAEPLYIGRDEMPSGHIRGTLREVNFTGRVLTGEEIKGIAARGVK